MTINDFVGTWYIQYKSGKDGTPLQDGWQLWIGTDKYGDREPFISGEGAVCVGIAVLDDLGQVVLTSDDPDGHQPAVLQLTGEQLRWVGYYEKQPAYIYISAAETRTVGGKTYVYLFGATTYGDPEQVAVWGGSGTPPSTPKKHPEEKG